MIEFLKKLLVVFDVLWKLAMLAALVAIAFELHAIANSMFVDDNPPEMPTALQCPRTL
ncbi:MAG: hypothetical protein ACR2I0_09705 [Rhodoferax sp.]